MTTKRDSWRKLVMDLAHFALINIVIFLATCSIIRVGSAEYTPEYQLLLAIFFMVCAIAIYVHTKAEAEAKKKGRKP